MRSFSLFLILGAADGHFNYERRATSKCNEASAYSILQMISTGSAFCSSLLYPKGDRTVTEKTTITGDCSTKVVTKTVFSTDIIAGVTTTLPVIKITEYKSTVFINSGTLGPIDKRDMPSTLSTPKALSTCTDYISGACSSLVPRVTTTVTSTKTKSCKVTSTFTETDEVEVTDKHFTQSIMPAPLVTSASNKVLTTTVPAACALPTGYFVDGSVPTGDNVIVTAYPNFPQTMAECCLVCWKTPNCVASAFFPDALLCELLVNINNTLPGVTSHCPLGVQDFGFGSPTDGGNVLPGPCGR